MRYRQQNRHNTKQANPWIVSGAILLLAATTILAGCGNIVGGLETERGTGAIATKISSSAVSASKIDSYTVTVSGPDIESRTQTFSGGTARMEVAATPGERTFTVSGSISDPYSFVTEITGESSAQVSADETTRVSVNLDTVTDSRILFADGGNNRVVMFDDMQGNGWKELYPTSGGNPVIQNPYDVDYDSEGRIYVAAENGLFRMDDMSGANLTEMAENAGVNVSDFEIRSVSLDRENGSVYFLHSGTSSGTLYRGPVVDTAPWANVDPFSPDFTGAKSIVVLSSGQVVIGGSGGVVFDPSTENTDYFYFSDSDRAIQDMRAVDGYVWAIASNIITLSTPVMAKLDPGLAATQLDVEVGSYGSHDGIDAGIDVGEFLGPVAFGASAGTDRAYIADVKYFLDPLRIDAARVVSVADFSGGGWSTFGAADQLGESEEDSETEDSDRGEFLFNLPIVGALFPGA